jgi:Predicted endonuclease containing a URI domain
MPFYTYILECADGSFYTGYTVNMDSRLSKHNSGKGGKYTRSHRPVKLLASWEFESRREAMQWEIKIKKLPREKKLELVLDKWTFHNSTLGTK